MYKRLFWSTTYKAKQRNTRIRQHHQLNVKTSYNWFLHLVAHKKKYKTKPYDLISLSSRINRVVLSRKDYKLRSSLNYSIRHSNLFYGEPYFAPKPNTVKNSELLQLIDISKTDYNNILSDKFDLEFPLNSKQIQYIKKNILKFKFYYLSNKLKCL